nr:unnamed protein product [Callosobruchus analis]
MLESSGLEMFIFKPQSTRHASRPQELGYKADYEKLLREMEDRNSRKQNIIIYNLPETPNLSKEEQAAADSQHVKRILGNLSNDITILDKPMRLGRFDHTKV